MARIIYQTEYEREEMESAGIDFNQTSNHQRVHGY